MTLPGAADASGELNSMAWHLGDDVCLGQSVELEKQVALLQVGLSDVVAVLGIGFANPLDPCCLDGAPDGLLGLGIARVRHLAGIEPGPEFGRNASSCSRRLGGTLSRMIL